MGRYDTDEGTTGDDGGTTPSTDEEVQAPETSHEDTSDQEGEESQGEVGSDEEGTEEQQTEAGDAEATFAVHLNGQDVEVPVSELTKGYLRQQDYTRKTQMLAQERDQLADATALVQALEANPQQTLAVLAKHYGMSTLDPDEIEGPSPEQTRLRELEAWQQAEVGRQREAAVDAEVGRLHAVYGDFDEDALFGFAVTHNVSHLETALRAMTFETNGGPKRVDKSKVAAQSGGSNHNGQARPKIPASNIRSFADAYEAAKAELTNGS